MIYNKWFANVSHCLTAELSTHFQTTTISKWCDGDHKACEKFLSCSTFHIASSVLTSTKKVMILFSPRLTESVLMNWHNIYSITIQSITLFEPYWQILHVMQHIFEDNNNHWILQYLLYGSYFLFHFYYFVWILFGFCYFLKTQQYQYNSSPAVLYS